MNTAPSALLLRHIHTLASVRSCEELPDDELVRRFVTQRDEAAFEALVRRHGALVLGVCRRVLRREQDAEDAFQATFLLLASKAGSLRARQSVGSWLHGVAYRVAQRARARAERRHEQEAAAAARRPADTLAEVTFREAQAILDEELARLPEKYRAPLVLCCLEGKARDEAARQLGWSPNRLRSRLEQARAQLHRRLVARGLTLSVPLLALTLTSRAAAGVPGRLVASTAAAAPHFATAAPPAGVVSAPVAALVRQGMRGVLLDRLWLGTALVVLGMIAAGAGLAARTDSVALPPAEQSGPDRPAPAREAQPAQERPLPEGARARLGSTWFRYHSYASILLFFPDGKSVVTGADSTAAARRDVSTGKVLMEFKGHKNPLAGVALSPDGSLLATGGYDGFVRVWRTKTGEEVWAGAKHKGNLNALAFSPDGKTLAVGDEWLVRLWDAEKGRELRKLPLQGFKFVATLAFSPDGKALAVGGEGGVNVWDAATGKALPRPEGKAPDYGYSSVTFSPDSKTIAAGARAQVVELWDAATGKSLWRNALARNRQLPGLRVAFSPDGKTLASSGGDGMVRMWDPVAGRELFRFDTMQGEIWRLAYSPDGKMLATAGAGSVRFWDPATGRALRTDSGHHAAISALVGSSRVDLQACKLEYSIVSPK